MPRPRHTAPPAHAARSVRGPGWFDRTFPVPAPGWIAPAWSALLIVRPAGQAQDYLTRAPETTTGPLTSGVDVLGFTRWGWAFAALVAAVLVALAVVELTGNRWAILLAHVYGAALHVAYVIALVDGLDGSGRGVGLLAGPLGAAAAHAMALGLYLGPRDRRRRA